MATFPSSTEVCIVGAGPTGLACALGLAARGIPFVVVDALDEGHNESRAVAIYASALESIAALNPQVSDDMVAAGVQGEAFTMIDRNEKNVFNIPFKSTLEAYTKFPFLLVVPQHTAEHRMRQGLERYGTTVLFNKRVCDMAESAQGSQYELRFETGETLTARYVVAADGCNSFVRSFAKIPFVNPITKKPVTPQPDDAAYVVADVLLEEPSTKLPRDRVQIKIGDDGFVLTGPLVDPSQSADVVQRLFRLYIGVPDIPPSKPDITYLQNILEARGPGSASTPRDVPKIAKVLHSSRYRSREAVADTFMHATQGGAYILLAGDAGHMNGPAGGQGMNLGIGEACELAEAIHEHRNASLAEKTDSGRILEAYSTHRREFASQVVEMVHGMTAVEAGGIGWAPYLRLCGLWTVTRLPFMQGVLAWQLSGLGRIKKVVDAK
ncbi:FAD/NAD(P)-binding domain-containing protein [Roridomyces roridus]|uniref:FAD/NAD(P)-binding domain-containing protein n=1 Tax=Roridomyces roridus TaxID=1738132 RepID=A0AAD7C5D6_9AGAR|nr:FAD/NAD(P)-binding domain-containing protein [Roridomyces roridus]